MELARRLPVGENRLRGAAGRRGAAGLPEVSPPAVRRGQIKGGGVRSWEGPPRASGASGGHRGEDRGGRRGRSVPSSGDVMCRDMGTARGAD